MTTNEANGGGDTAFRWDSARVWAESGFLAFLEAHGINRSDLLPPDGAQATLSRFFRLKKTPVAHSDGTGAAITAASDHVKIDSRSSRVLASIGEDLKREGVESVPEPVGWLEGFYSLPAAAPLARIDAYQRGDIYGVDVSSGYCVSLLGIRPGDHVLDLCCAPGAKLSMIADLLAMRGSVTGVDCSRQRIGACKQLVHKYQLIQSPASVPHTVTATSGGDTKDEKKTIDVNWRCRLFCADGRAFSVGPSTESADLHSVEVVLDTHEIAARGPRGLHRKRKNKSARARERKRQRLATSVERTEPIEEGERYDKVLVDAECTHDGSVRHLQKLKSLKEWREYVANHLSERQVDRILKLQHDLIRNGFRLLRPGGTMIYSTCSLSVKQNEEIVQEFLMEEADARLEPIDRAGIPCLEGRLAGTVRFTPSNNTSGLFVAKIRRHSISVNGKMERRRHHRDIEGSQRMGASAVTNVPSSGKA